MLLILAMLALAAVPSFAVPVHIVPTDDPVPVRGQSCPNVSVVTGFDLNQYLGQWHEIAVSQIPRLTYEKDCDCTTANYSLTDTVRPPPPRTRAAPRRVLTALSCATFPDLPCATPSSLSILSSLQGTVKVSNTCNKKSPTGTLQTAVGEAKVGDAPAKLLVRFSEYSPWGNYWVTELGAPAYQNYVIVWSCQEILGIRSETLWILARTPTLSDADMKQALADAQEKTGFDVSSLHHTTQQGCTYPNYM